MQQIRRRSRMMFQKNVLMLLCMLLIFSTFGLGLSGSHGQAQQGNDGAIEIVDADGQGDAHEDVGGEDTAFDLLEAEAQEPLSQKDNLLNGIAGMDQEGAGIGTDEVFGPVSKNASLTNKVVEHQGERTSTQDQIQPMSGPGDFAGGTGTEDDPYLIEDAVQLDKVREQNSGQYFKLIKDIDLSSYDNWKPLSSKDDSEHRFVGYFDGNGFTISNLKINRGNEDNVGLFGRAFAMTDPVTPEVPQKNPSVIDDGIGASHQTNDAIRVEGNDKSSAKLPKTATTYFTLLSIGMLLVLCGGVLYVYRRKNRIS